MKEKYGANKLTIARETLRHPEALNDYRQAAQRSSRPITHDQLAEIENIALPNFSGLLSALAAIPVGREAASDYETAVEKLLSALFFPSLSSPTKQHQIHQGRKRIDITYVNNPTNGFFNWVLLHYPSSHIFVECKNYGKEIRNPEFDQLAGRFSPSRGQIGLLVCRSVENPAKLAASCRDTANDKRGYVIVLSDGDLAQLVTDYQSSNGGSEYPLLLEKFRQLIM